MSTANVIAVVGAIIAIIAAGAAIWSALWTRKSGQIQRSSAQDELQNQFNQVISTLTKLQADAGELGAQGMAAPGGDQATQAKQFGIGNQLIVFAFQAHDMLNPKDKDEPTPEISGAGAYVLATTFDQSFYVGLADHYWELAVANAGTDAKVFALVGQARHFFFRNDMGDLDAGRKCHAAALALVPTTDHGHDSGCQERFLIYWEASQAEYGADNHREMITALWSCFDETRQIHTPSRAWPCKVQLFDVLDRFDLLGAMTAAPECTPERREALETQLQEWRHWRDAAAQAHAAGAAAAGGAAVVS
jgi:hypothetical protein